MKKENKIEDLKLADDVEYIIIQKVNPSNREDTTGEIIASFSQNDYQIAGDYMLRIKYKETKKD